MRTVSNLVDEFKHFLDVNHPEHSNAFSQRHPEAARAEAVIFSFFKQNGYDIRVEETPYVGGVDFRVLTENSEFVVEVTSISQNTVTERSGVPTKLTSGEGYHSDRYAVANRIRQEAFDKAIQMSGYDCPVILVITSEHPEYANILKDKHTDFNARMFMTSPPKIELEYNTETHTNRIVGNVTDLQESLFFRFNRKGRIEFCREQMSAVLLFYIHEKYEALIVGLLHPKPIYQFSHEILPSVRFVALPIPEQVINTEMEDYSIADFGGQIKPIWIPDESFPYSWEF